MLKGKAKIDFEQWYDNEFNGYEYLSHRIKRIKSRFHFWDMPNCFQQGALLEFFRKRGYKIAINIFFTPFTGYNYTIHGSHESFINMGRYTDYNTAFTHAIDKACEIYGGEG